ncbi:hypothetical protein [Bacillus benzoevorans]|uniref:TolA-binding protein n=1 Tax=Bacillus benzoevorans TaxID=1456 RepID=A0A7X0HPV3_9BACI|nr:hypothetical protein [Bacillus benzoevorans]MBB6444663.1 TolA-binding protein [Bacillus benzoevorans]
MGTTVLRKEELMAMLQSISSQLDQLEKSIETIIPKKQIEWQMEQNMQIEQCAKQLDELEIKISSIDENKDADHSTTALRINQSFEENHLLFS